MHSPLSNLPVELGSPAFGSGDGTMEDFLVQIKARIIHTIPSIPTSKQSNKYDQVYQRTCYEM